MVSIQAWMQAMLKCVSWILDYPSGGMETPVWAMHIFGDKGNANLRHRVHAKPTQDLYMAMPAT